MQHRLLPTCLETAVCCDQVEWPAEPLATLRWYFRPTFKRIDLDVWDDNESSYETRDGQHEGSTPSADPCPIRCDEQLSREIVKEVNSFITPIGSQPPRTQPMKPPSRLAVEHLRWTEARTTIRLLGSKLVIAVFLR